MSETGIHYTDVTELSLLLQCLGFTVKSLEVNDGSASQLHDDGVARSIVISCQTSGYNMVLEHAGGACSCPPNNDSSWHVEGITGGVRKPKEFGNAAMGSLPRQQRERMSQELRRLIQCMVELTETSQLDCSKSNSLPVIASPEMMSIQLKVDSPRHYRSLDALSRDDPELPPPGSLEKPASIADDGKRRRMIARQQTYTVRRPLYASAPGICNKTSSPIQDTQSSLLRSLEDTDRAAEELRLQLGLAMQELSSPRPQEDESIADLALDFSQISIFKEPSKSQFASSPNLSVLSHAETSASTSTLGTSKVGEKKVSKLRRLSPGFFFRQPKKDGQAGPGEKVKAQDGKNKFQNIFKPKFATPVRIPARDSISNLSISSINKKKFSHIKSTIPKPSPTPSRKEY